MGASGTGRSIPRSTRNSARRRSLNFTGQTHTHMHGCEQMRLGLCPETMFSKKKSKVAWRCTPWAR